MEQGDVLRNHRNRLAKALLGDPGDVLAIDRDAALVHVVKSLQQHKQRGFPTAGRANQPDPLAGVQAEAELVEYLQASGIAERHLVEDDRRPRLDQRFGFRMVAQFVRKQQRGNRLGQSGSVLGNVDQRHGKIACGIQNR